MAEQRETIVFDVQLDAQKVAEGVANAAHNIDILKNEQKLLNQQLRDGKIDQEMYGKAIAQSNAALEQSTRDLKSLTAQMKIVSKDTNSYGTSLNEQRRKLLDMQKAYDGLDAKFRNSSAGKKFLKQIQAQDKAVKDLEKSTGRAQRSVGDYTGALEKAGVGINGFTSKMKAAFSSGWVLLITAIVVVIKKLVDAFKGSETRMKEFRTAMAPLKGAVDVLQQVFDKLAKLLSGVLAKAIEGITKGVKWLFGALDKLGKSFGQDWGLAKAFDKAAENSEKATEAEQKYIEHRRRWVTEEATIEKNVAELRAKAVEKDKYTTAERIAFMQQAIDLEKKAADERKKLAQENLAALQAEANRSENDAEMNDRLAEARAEVTRAETEYLNTERNLNKQIIAFKKEEEAATKSANAEEEKAAREREKQLREQQKTSKAALDYRLQVQVAALGEDKEFSKESYDIYMQYYAELIALYAKDSAEYYTAMKEKEKYEQQYQEKRKEMQEKADTFLAQFSKQDKLKDQYQQRLNDLDEYHRQGLVATEEYEHAKAEIESQYREQKAQADMEQIQNFMSQFSALNTAISDIQNAELEQYKQDQEEKKKALDKRLKSGEISEEQYAAETQKLDEETAQKEKELALQQAKRNKAMNIMQTVINTAAAIMKIWADVPKMDFGASTIALTAVAAALGAAQIAAIAAEPLPQFAEGGVVPGTSYTGDKVLARLNSGEGVLTQQGMQNLQDAANNGLGMGVNYDAMAAAMTQAVAAMPAPRMAYDEFKQFEQNVATYNEIAAI